VGVVVADDIETAERRFFATWDVARAAPRGAPQPPRRDLRAQPAASGDIIGLFPQPGGPR
jgi:hypothetical protein